MNKLKNVYIYIHIYIHCWYLLILLSETELQTGADIEWPMRYAAKPTKLRSLASLAVHSVRYPWRLWQTSIFAVGCQFKGQCDLHGPSSLAKLWTALKVQSSCVGRGLSDSHGILAGTGNPSVAKQNHVYICVHLVRCLKFCCTYLPWGFAFLFTQARCLRIVHCGRTVAEVCQSAWLPCWNHKPLKYRTLTELVQRCHP
jgi:hypothetical protein